MPAPLTSHPPICSPNYSSCFHIPLLRTNLLLVELIICTPFVFCALLVDLRILSASHDVTSKCCACLRRRPCLWFVILPNLRVLAVISDILAADLRGRGPVYLATRNCCRRCSNIQPTPIPLIIDMSPGPCLVRVRVRQRAFLWRQYLSLIGQARSRQT